MEMGTAGSSQGTHEGHYFSEFKRTVGIFLPSGMCFKNTHAYTLTQKHTNTQTANTNRKGNIELFSIIVFVVRLVLLF